MANHERSWWGKVWYILTWPHKEPEPKEPTENSPTCPVCPYCSHEFTTRVMARGQTIHCPECHAAFQFGTNGLQVLSMLLVVMSMIIGLLFMVRGCALLKLADTF